MTYKLPSEAEEWVAEYERKLNESDQYSHAGEGWGVGFNGDFLFEIQPDGSYDGEPVYMYLELQDGACLDAYVTEGPESEDYGFAFRGGYEQWKRLTAGEINPVEGMMDGTFDLDGDMQKVMQFSQAAIVMTETASEIDTEFEY
ncbi:sterol carrier protein [Halovenus sp. WSH3]|uniref:Sterol carrier protein n=1 Tax=Halovenus carboxidivorans TaxID=2692199 RepID=A0A6B0T2T8_9EURY|nr:SCP2 sterol-binding domain-containing protein [Halovenus carboxidivorans]MXR52568.1 sterol carrier protein [Halovenus carboxidivorans]